jgi:hypothetical protein
MFDRWGKLLLALAILGSEFSGTHDHILPSHDSGSRATPNGCSINIELLMR